MAIIYTYPRLTSPSDEDLLIVTDVTDNSTKSMRIGDIPITPGDVVDTFTNAFGTYITGTPNASAKGNVNIGTLDLSAVDGTAVSATRFLSKDNTWDVPPVYSGGANVGYVPTGGDAVKFLRGDGTWVTPASGGNDIEIEDEGVQIASAVEKIDFTGGGITASGDNTKVTVNVLPRLNQGFSPYPIYQGDENIDIASGATNAIGVQTIVDTAAPQITVCRVFGTIPEDCTVNVGVYSGVLTSFVPSGTDTTALIAYGSTTATASSAGTGIYRIDLDNMTPLPSATWAPVAGTPIVVVIEVDNSAGSTTAKILGTLAKTGSTITTDYGNALAFEIPGSSSVFTVSNTAAGEEVSKLANFASNAEATEKRICHHFDPSAP